MCACAFVCRVRACVRVPVHARVRECLRVCVRACVHVCVHACVCACVRVSFPTIPSGLFINEIGEDLFLGPPFSSMYNACNS